MFARTRFKKDIVAEFILPAKPSTGAIILCPGMPGAPRADAAMEFFCARGFAVFLPRYRGTWESGGRFLAHPPHEDILDIIGEIPKGFTDLWTGRQYRLPAASCRRMFLIGGSFGGAVAILASRDPRVKKAIALSPVVDWRAPSRSEPMEKLGRYLPKAFGDCYRFSKNGWGRLSRGGLGNPLDETDTIDGRKLLLFHAEDDQTVPYFPTKRFSLNTGAALATVRRGGHFGVSDSIRPRFFRRIKRFLARASRKN